MSKGVEVFLVIDYWKLSREVMDSCISLCLFKPWVSWCVLSFVGEIIHWQCEIASGRNCGLQEVGVAPWAVCLWVPASTSILILLFRLTCGWTNPSNQQHISTCDYFRLYSKTFNPSCACKSQDSSLFLWLGLSMKMEVVQHVLAVPQSDL